MSNLKNSELEENTIVIGVSMNRLAPVSAFRFQPSMSLSPFSNHSERINGYKVKVKVMKRD